MGSVQFTYQSNGDTKGLLYYIGTKGKRQNYINPCDRGLVSCSSTTLMSDSRDIKNFAGRTSLRLVCKPQDDNYMYIDLKNGIKIKITGYSLRHYSSWDTEALRHWDFQASNVGDSWTTLKSHRGDSSLTTKGQIVYFSITKTEKYYTQFRIIQRGYNSNNHKYLACSGIELYGVCTNDVPLKINPYYYGVHFNYSYGGDKNGLLYYMGTKCKKYSYVNPYDRSLVKCSSSALTGDSNVIEKLAGRSSLRLVCKPQDNNYMRIDLQNDISILLNGYSIRHYSSWDTEALRNWDFQGSNNGDGWTTLKRHRNDCSLSKKGQIVYFSITTNKSYSQFRIDQVGLNSNRHTYLACSGIELYGDCPSSINKAIDPYYNNDNDEKNDVSNNIQKEINSIKENKYKSRKQIYKLAKSVYKQQGTPVVIDTANVLNDITRNSSNYINVALPLTLAMDKDFNTFDKYAFKRQFANKMNIPYDCIKILSVKSGSTIIDMKLETHKGGEKLLISIECIAERISTEKAKKSLVEFGIFAMEFGKVTAGDAPLKQRVIMNPRWNREYGSGHTHWEGPNPNDGKSRGNEPYFCPSGWKRFSVQFTTTPFDFDNVYDYWPVAYHGTKFDYCMAITLKGLMASNKCAVWGSGVYLSPSIKYVSHPRYCVPVKLNLNEGKQKGWTSEHCDMFRKYHGKWVQCAFACRVKPGSYKKLPETMGLGKNGTFDGIDKNEIEWLVQGQHGKFIGQDKILIYGFMIKASNTEPTGY